MARIEAEIEIAAGPMSVFRFCHDLEHRPDWDERVTSAQMLTPGPLRSGSVIQYDTRPSMGDVFSWEGEIVEHRYPSKSRLRVIDAAPSSSFVSGSESWQFNSVERSTRVTYVWDYKPRGIIGKVLDPLVRRGATRRAIKRSLENLKKAVEAQLA